LKKNKLLLISLFLTGFLHAQKTIEDTREYMKDNLPSGWSMENNHDSVFVFNKIVHYQTRIDPPMDYDGEDDTMTLFVRFYPLQTDSDKINYEGMLKRIAEQKQELETHRSDSTYRGKRGFYDWWGKFNQLTRGQEMFEFTHFKNGSITFMYFGLRDPFKSYDDTIDKETELIKNILINYLQ
jgi:hypothetical protein